MLERKISKYLDEWKVKKKKKALLVTGASQTGKTFSIRKFGKENYEVFIEINFAEDKAAADVFANVSVAYALIDNLTAYKETSLKPGKTLIFLDEIQACPKAREAVRLLVKDGRYDCIEAGFIEEVFDYEEKYSMRPLDLEEFMYANGIKSDAIEYVRDCYEQKWVVSGSAHEMLKRIFGYYVVVGGMPEAVQLFVDTHDMGKVTGVHKRILKQYRQDIEKAGNISNIDKTKMNKILDFVPVELNKTNKRFLLADIKKSARMERYESSLNKLEGLGMTLPCYYVSSPRSPLGDNEKRNLFKLYLADSGLLCAMSAENTQLGIMQGKLEPEMESIIQNAFAQTLTANGFVLRYINDKNKGEVDFLVQKDEDVIPIEIKAGDTYKSHAALDLIMEQKEPELKKGFIFCDRNVEKEGNIFYLPWYMIMFLQD
ncbi:MAG: ATP-binding protein [Lachnospiraceae bacterium]|nr:ATP-binding protein [Lachnospiraceae bacterium]